MDFKAGGIKNFKISEGIYVSPIPEVFSLEDSITTRPLFCHWKHASPSLCKECATLIDFGKHILGVCVVELASSYKRFFPLVKYKAEQAVRKLLQMPVTIIQMTLNGPGSQRLYALELLQGVDIPRVINMAEKCLQGKTCFQSGMSREVLKDL